jgi:hypothetical protein
MKRAMTARRLCLGLAATSLLLVPPTAGAAGKSAKKVDKKAPVVTKVTPKSVKVGDVLTLTGKNFVRGKGKNQVFFFTAKGGGTWAVADDASATRLKVRVPDKLANLLPTDGGNARILLRVKGKRLGERTATRVSPLIAIKPDATGSGSGSGTGTPGCTPNPANPTSDVDGDLVPDYRERDALLDPCNRDSDGDTVSDGFEYNSALDLNSAARPYPGKRPYPNPLDKNDAGVDYDGDGLTVADEYTLWTKYGGGTLPLSYSDGKQKSVVAAAPSSSGPLYYMDLDGDGTLSDDERDADGDGLGNWDESHGRMLPSWWTSTYSKAPNEETPYPVTFAGTSMVDPDSDGDGVADGADDQDFDGLSNSFEISRAPGWSQIYVAIGHNWNGTATTDPDGTGPLTAADARFYARVQPFNPCKPVWSDKCHRHPPFDYYKESELWMGVENAPAPGARPGDV